MKPIELKKTIYLGDRYVKYISFDDKNKILKIKIDIISRIRGDSGWNYYNDENIIDGFIVFENVEKYDFVPSNIKIENVIDLDVDGMELEPIIELKRDDLFEVTFQFYHYIPDQKKGEEIILKIIASGMYLEDPSKPGLKIIN